MTKRYPHKKILTIGLLVGSFLASSMMPLEGVLAQTKSSSQLIIDNIYKNKDLSHFKIEISDSPYSLSIRGEVSSEEKKHQILEIVKSVVGNKTIEDQITVNPDKFGHLNVSDTDIRKGIDKVLNEENLSRTNYNLKDGVVYVQGEFKTFREVDYIFSLMQNIPGVKKVVSEATVGSKPYMQDFKDFQK
jgi:osmotically-inducible protein OsmY